MRIIVGESGKVTTEHSASEFRLLQGYVTIGNLSTSTAHRQPDFIGAEGEIGPIIHTAEGAKSVATATAIRNARGIRISTLANATLRTAEDNARLSREPIVVEWGDRDSVQAVRSRVLIGLLEEGYRPGSMRSDPEGETLPGQVLYDGLCAVEDVLQLTPAEAALRAALYNNDELTLH